MLRTIREMEPQPTNQLAKVTIKWIQEYNRIAYLPGPPPSTKLIYAYVLLIPPAHAQRHCAQILTRAR